MFMQNKISPCSLTKGKIQSCIFNPRLLQLTLKYKFDSGEEQSQPFNISVGMFKNPVVKNKRGFYIEALDKDEYSVSKTRISQRILGVNQSAEFKTYDFNYADTAASG